MSSDRPEANAAPKQWPGERNPTRWDVHDANESPATTFLNRFRAALLHNEGAEGLGFLDAESSVENDDMDDIQVRSLSMFPKPVAAEAFCRQIQAILTRTR